jgi:uncharacterized membrane protein (DUF2068 family)
MGLSSRIRAAAGAPATGPTAARPEPAGPPGTERPRRYRPRLRYELIGCGLHGHELLGTTAARLRPQDALFARQAGGLRWYRCLRCDSWLPLRPPEHPAQEYPPRREDVELPLRGRPLRDRYVLRLIAADRALHFLVLSALAAAILLFAGDKAALNHEFTKILQGLQGVFGGPVNTSRLGVVHDLRRLFAVRLTSLYLVGAAAAVYAAMEGTEAVGLWLGRRWAEYLTFVATAVFVPYEVWELTKSISVLKILTLVINVAIVAYLVVAKRLFGVRGGGRAEQAERDTDSGWAALEATDPGRDARTPEKEPGGSEASADPAS